MMMRDIRPNGLTGFFEEKGLDTSHSIHFSQWWSGEGFDVTVDNNPPLALNIAHLHLLAVMAVATNTISIEELIEETEKFRNKP